MEERKISSSSNLSKPELEAEARKMRRDRFFGRGRGRLDSGTVLPSAGGLLMRIVFVLVTLVCVISAVLLLALPGLRNGVVAQMAGMFTPDQDNRLYNLPAPPPKAPNVTEQFQGSSGVVADDEILYSGSQQPGKIEPFSEKSDPVNLPRTPGSRSAFAFMQEDDGLIGALLKGKNGDLEFKTWNLISQTPPIYLLDLVALPSGEEKELHLIFSVDMSKKEIAALSQAARDFIGQ